MGKTRASDLASQMLLRGAVTTVARRPGPADAFFEEQRAAADAVDAELAAAAAAELNGRRWRGGRGGSRDRNTEEQDEDEERIAERAIEANGGILQKVFPVWSQAARDRIAERGSLSPDVLLVAAGDFACDLVHDGVAAVMVARTMYIPAS